MKPCRSPYCECSEGKCTHQGYYDARGENMDEVYTNIQRMRTTSDGSSLVDPLVHWIPIDKDTPQGVKMLLINEQRGVAVISSYHKDLDDFTHYAGLPKFNRKA